MAYFFEFGIVAMVVFLNISTYPGLSRSLLTKPNSFESEHGVSPPVLASMTWLLSFERSYSSAPRKLRPLMALSIIEVFLDAKEDQSQALGLGLQLIEQGVGDGHALAFVGQARELNEVGGQVRQFDVLFAVDGGDGW